MALKVPTRQRTVFTVPVDSSSSSKLSSWVSTGIRKKPEGCRRCPLSLVDTGFVPDEYPPSPLIAVLLERPGWEEVLEQRPLIGKAGRLWLSRLIKRTGHEREDVLICNTLRCFRQGNVYPTGWERKQGEKCCRQWDHYHRTPEDGTLRSGGLGKFDPNLIMVTYHPAALLRTPAFYWPTLRAVEVAFEKAREGWRPLLCMGDKAAMLVGKWMEGTGGMKTWQRHWWTSTLPWLTT